MQTEHKVQSRRGEAIEQIRLSSEIETMKSLRKECVKIRKECRKEFSTSTLEDV